MLLMKGHTVFLEEKRGAARVWDFRKDTMDVPVKAEL